MEQKIKDALEQIRPFCRETVGDIEFVGVYRRQYRQGETPGTLCRMPGRSDDYQGRCGKILKESYPEVAGVEAVL